jgi:hypothetical protein
MSATAAETKAYHKDYGIKNKQRIDAQRALRYQIEKKRELLTRSASAVYLGLTLQKLYNISNSKVIRWNIPEHLDEKGVVRYHKKDLDNWRLHNPQYYDEWALIKKGYYTMSAEVMLITEWSQASKHVTAYCNKQRVAINSNNLWGRWA